MYCLQNRWKREKSNLVYYGLRSKKNLFKNKIKITKEQKKIIAKLPCDLSTNEMKIVKDLINIAIVEDDRVNKTPNSLKEARFCSCCAANDFMIPGLEFDSEGKCPICQTKEIHKELRSVVPVVNHFPKSKKSRFDVAVFYTGGKDSTYLLYYLSKVLKRNVLALTWEIPYMSDSARLSIENAKKKLDTVEFITRYVSNTDLKKMYEKLYSLSGNTCACPSLAYVLFYPELVANKIPYFIVGNEPAQIAGLYYNHMAPKIAYKFSTNKLLNALINVGRIITLHPPLKSGQFHTLATMKQLAYGDNIFKKMSGYSNALVSNVVESIKEVKHLTKPLKRSIRISSWTGNIPRFVQVDFNEISGGVYDWRNVKDTIIRECGWVAPEDLQKGLHTSCRIEKCKEYTQYIRFRNMESTMIPFSALEMAFASQTKALTKEEAITEIEGSLGFSIEEIPECIIMRSFFKS